MDGAVVCPGDYAAFKVKIIAIVYPRFLAMPLGSVVFEPGRDGGEREWLAILCHFLMQAVEKRLEALIPFASPPTSGLGAILPPLFGE